MGVLASSPLLAARVTSSESPRCAGVRVLFCYAVSFVRALGAYLYGSLFSSPCRNIGVSAVLSGRVDVVSRVVPLCKLVHSAQRCAQTVHKPQKTRSPPQHYCEKLFSHFSFLFCGPVGATSVVLPTRGG